VIDSSSAMRCANGWRATESGRRSRTLSITKQSNQGSRMVHCRVQMAAVVQQEDRVEEESACVKTVLVGRRTPYR
jgi:hypothetical protein